VHPRLLKGCQLTASTNYEKTAGARSDGRGFERTEDKQGAPFCTWQAASCHSAAERRGTVGGVYARMYLDGATKGSSYAVCWQEDPREESATNPADNTPPPSSQAKSPVSMSGRASGRLCTPEEHEGINEDDFSFDDDYDPLDLERIEADYRATRARAMFSAGAATRIVRLERMRSFSCMHCDAASACAHNAVQRLARRCMMIERPGIKRAGNTPKRLSSARQKPNCGGLMSR